MKNQSSLNIYCFNQPALNTEWDSLRSDKYKNALPFEWKIVENLEDAQVIAWDGVISPKGRHYTEQVIQKLKDGALLLLMGEGRTLFKDSSVVELLDLDQIRYVELSGWSLLPEDILATLEVCNQKIAHV